MGKKLNISFFQSLKFKIFGSIIVAVTVTYFAIEIPLLVKARTEVEVLSSSYLKQVAIMTGWELEEKIDDDGYGVLESYEQLNEILGGRGIENMNSSYLYLVDKEGTMLYHSSKDKIGGKVENPAVNGLVNELAAGRNIESGTTKYNYKGADKLAAFYVLSDQSAIVVGTVDYLEAISVQRSMIALGTQAGMVILVIFILVALSLAASIAKPLTKVTEAVDRASDLDLREPENFERLLKRKDEVGKIANAVNDMDRKLRDVVKDLKDQSKNLEVSADEINKSIKNTSTTTAEVEKTVVEISEGTNNQAEQTQKATESVIIMGNMVEEANAEVDNLSETAGIMKKSGQNAAGILEELEKINVKATESIEEISTQTATTNESAKKIREATVMIADIAEETNLLSLNASIEAARAGEQGRGFAVVASQIQKLAEQSNESARQIEEIVESLIRDSEQAVETMDVVKEIITEQSDKVSKTGEIFSEVIEGIGTSIKGIENISEKTKKLDEARTSVVGVVENLTSIAEENAAGTEEASASIGDVAGIISGISGSVETLDEVATLLAEKVDLFTL
jgi:methyl-accepting chemotaxis protein